MSPMNKLTRRAFAAAAALTAAALATTLLPSTAQQATQGPVKIGALMSLTGDLQAFGENCLKGIKLAIDQINAAGGILGSPAQVVEADDQTSAQPAIDAAQRLVTVEKVAGIIGALGSGITIPVATTVSVPNRIPQISPASTAPTQEPQGKISSPAQTPSDPPPSPLGKSSGQRCRPPPHSHRS